MYLSLYTYINISRSPPLCQDYTWSFRNSPMGWILLTSPCKEINLRQRWSIVSKAMTQTQSDLPLPKSIILPLWYLEISHYKPLLTSFHYTISLPSFFLHVHILYSPITVKFFLFNPHCFPLPCLYICCLLHVEFSFLSSLPGVHLLILQVLA